MTTPHLQIFWGGASVASLSLSGVKLLLLVLDPDRTGGRDSLLHGERSLLPPAGAALLWSALTGRSRHDERKTVQLLEKSTELDWRDEPVADYSRILNQPEPFFPVQQLVLRMA